VVVVDVAASFVVSVVVQVLKIDE